MQGHASFAPSRLFSGWKALNWVQQVLSLQDAMSLSFRVQIVLQCCESRASLSFTLQVAVLKQKGHRETIRGFSLVFGCLLLRLHACVARESANISLAGKQTLVSPYMQTPVAEPDRDPHRPRMCTLKTVKPWSDASVFVFSIVRSSMSGSFLLF